MHLFVCYVLESPPPPGHVGILNVGTHVLASHISVLVCQMCVCPVVRAEPVCVDSLGDHSIVHLLLSNPSLFLCNQLQGNAVKLIYVVRGIL